MYYRGWGAFVGSGTGAGYAKVLGLLDATIAAKLAKYHTGESPGRGKRERDAREQVNSDREKFAVNKELLYNGQGKINTIVTNFSTESHMECGPAEGQEGLQAPNIRETGDAVTGDLRRIMRRDSKQWRQELKLQQRNSSQWSTHGSTVDTSGRPATTQLSMYRNSMCPSGRALHHPAAELLNQWATFGCPMHTGHPWTKEEM
jgi:hypothetical protein